MSEGPRRGPDPLVACVLVALLAIGVALRVRHVSTAFLDGDELHSLPSLDYPYKRLVRSFDYEGSGLALPLLQKLSVDLLGPGVTALRLPALLPALLTLLLVPWFLWRPMGAGPTLVATAVLVANGFHAFYAAFARSYGLVGLLSLLLVVLASRLVEAERPRPRNVVGLALVAGLLPWAHLTTAPFVAAVFAALLLARWWSGGGASRLLPVCAAAAGAAVIVTALYAPALPRVLEVTRLKSSERYEGHFDAVDVAGLMALGDRASGWGLLVLLATAAALVLRFEGIRRLPIVVGALSPIPLIFVVRPYGDAYAYARYAMPALPVIILLVAAGLRIATREVQLSPRAWALAALGLALGLSSVGPLAATDDGPFANSYLTLEPLPAFDAPYPAQPGAYRAIPPDASIIEMPALLENRACLLYRNYYLRQPRTTLMGFLPEEEPVPPGPYKAARPHQLAGQADYLFVHRDVEREADAYWRFVYQSAWPRLGGSRALMERQARFGRPLPKPEPALLERLERRFGAPAFADDVVLVYRLR